jgi:hypothetical protein
VINLKKASALQIPKMKNYASFQEISSIAEIQAPWTKTSAGRVSKNKISNQIVRLPRNGGDPVMYVINYENNGFIIVSADKRISPILAYSDEGRFATDQKVIPGGIVSWMTSVNETISSIRNSNIKQDETVKRLWKRYSEEQILNLSTSTNSSGRTNTTVYIGDCNNGDSGFTEFTDGLVATPTWDQGSGYNELLTNAGCSQTGNGRYWTGCVATATAEIMRFYNHPASYNWATMPTNTGSAETSRLMRDIGTAGNLSIDYGCDGSSAKSENVPRTLLNFGYSQASYVNYNIWNAKSELSNGRPILIRGRESFWDDFTPEGHLWVAEGVQYWGYYTCAPDPNTPGEWVASFTGYDCSMRMNWGWGGAFNGWYSANNFNPGGRNYNYANKMVYGIRP